MATLLEAKKAEIERLILHRLNFEPSKGTTFGHLMSACKLQTHEFFEGKPQDRLLDQALQRLRKRGTIRFIKSSREWTIAGKSY